MENKNKAVKHRIIHNLTAQCNILIRSIDVVLLVYTCIINKNSFSPYNVNRLSTSFLQKSNYYRHKILQSKFSQNHILSPINIGTAMELSYLLDRTVSLIATTAYTIASVAKQSQLLLSGYDFVKEAIVATRMCAIITEKIIDGTDEIFTKHKTENIRLLSEKARGLFYNVHKKYSQAIHNLYKETPKKNFLVFSACNEIYNSIFAGFSKAFLIVTKITVTLKQL